MCVNILNIYTYWRCSQPAREWNDDRHIGRKRKLYDVYAYYNIANRLEKHVRVCTYVRTYVCTYEYKRGQAGHSEEEGLFMVLPGLLLSLPMLPPTVV